MKYLIKTLITCAAAGLVGSYIGKSTNKECPRHEHKEDAKRVEQYEHDKVEITDRNKDWTLDIILQKRDGIYKIHCKSDGTLKITHDLDKKVEQEMVKIDK